MPRDDYGEIKWMRIDPRHQRRGFGRAVLVRLQCLAGEFGFRRLRLDITTGQLAAQALYRSEGWEPTGERLRVGGLEVLFFEKQID